MKRFLPLLLSFSVITSAFAIPAFAAQPVEANTVTNVDVLAWPGEGPAKPISAIEIYDPDYLDDTGREKHIGLTVKVTGYGSEYAYLNDERIQSYKTKPFIIYGTLADGFYRYFDFGELPAGKYKFNIKMVSHNAPTSMSDWVRFEVTEEGKVIV